MRQYVPQFPSLPSHYLYLRSSLSVGRCHASWTNWALKMEQVSSSETSVTTDWHGVISRKTRIFQNVLHFTTLQRAKSVFWRSVICDSRLMKSCRFEVLKAVVMKRPVTPYRLAQLPKFRRKEQLPSSGQTEKSKSRGGVCILDGMNRPSERKRGPMGILVLHSGRGRILRCVRHGTHLALIKDYSNSHGVTSQQT